MKTRQEVLDEYNRIIGNTVVIGVCKQYDLNYEEYVSIMESNNCRNLAQLNSLFVSNPTIKEEELYFKISRIFEKMFFVVLKIFFRRHIR